MSRFYNLEYTLFYTLADHLFEDAVSNKFKEKDSFTLNDYNSIQKSIHGLLNSNAAQHLYGKDNIKLFEYNDVLVLKNINNDSMILFEDFELKKPGNEKYNEIFQDALRKVYDILQENSLGIYSERFQNIETNMKELKDFDMDHDDLMLFTELITSSPPAQKLMRCESIEDFLSKKLNTQQKIELEINDSFYKHYKNIESVPYFNLFDSNSEHERYERISNFINNDLRMDSLIPMSLDETTTEYKFVTVKKNNKVIGGFSIEDKENYYNIYSIDLLRTEDNKENYIEILNQLNNVIKDDKRILLKTSGLENIHLKDAIVEVNGSKYIKDLKEIENFEQIVICINENGISRKHKGNIFKLLNSEKSLNVLNELHKNIQKFKEKIENLDRVQFNYLMTSKNIKEKDKKYSLLGFEFNKNIFQIKDNDIEKMKTLVFETLVKSGINLDMFQQIELEEDLAQKSRFNIQNESFDSKSFEYKFNDLYDFLLSKSIIKNDKKIKIYRLETNTSIEESKNGRGLYNIELLDSQKNDTYVADRYDRRMPHQEPLIKDIFDRNYSESSTHKEWFFGFKSKEQMTNWFDSSTLKEMEDSQNLKIVVYEVNESSIIGNHKQVIFKKKESEKKYEIKISDFLEIKAPQVKNVRKNKNA